MHMNMHELCVLGHWIYLHSLFSVVCDIFVNFDHLIKTRNVQTTLVFEHLFPYLASSTKIVQTNTFTQHTDRHSHNPSTNNTLTQHANTVTQHSNTRSSQHTTFLGSKNSNHTSKKTNRTRTAHHTNSQNTTHKQNQTTNKNDRTLDKWTSWRKMWDLREITHL